MSKNQFLHLAVLLLASQPSFSQEDSSARQLEEVVVTATRYPVKQSQTGKVIIIIGREELEKNPGKNLGEILNEQAGVLVNGSLNAQGTPLSVYTRGAASGRTLVTIDGVPVGDPSLPDNEFDINLISTESIEQIEICKGAQSTLYGSDAVAGVINIITIKPDLNKPMQVKASLAGGNYGTLKANAQVYGRLVDHLLYNIRYTHSSTDGFSTAYDSTGGKSHFDNDGYYADALTSNISWNVNSALLVKSFVQYSRYTTDLDQGAFTDAKDYTNTSKNLMLGGGVVYTLAGTSITGNYLYNESNRHLLEDSTYGQTYYTDHYYGKSQYAEIFAKSKLSESFTLLNGADFRYASMSENGLSGTYPLTFKDTSVSQTSMYSSLLYSGPSGLNIELGGRLNTHSRYGSNFTYTFNPSFLLANKWKIYGSIASGYKAPSLYQLYGPLGGNPNLQPETSVNYEGGVQYSDQSVTTRVTYFNRTIRDGIDYNYFTSLYFNYDGEHAQGIEWEIKMHLSSVFSLAVNYTWLHVREQSQSRLTYKDTVYSYALRRPASTVNIMLGIQPSKKWLINLGGHYESRRYDIGGYDANFNPLQDVTLASFFILHAYGEYKLSDRFKFFAEGKNITNRKFFTINGYNSIPALFVAGAAISL